MTANEMKFNFQLKFDALNTYNSPSYDDRQVGYLLTEAQYRIFLDYYDPFNNRKNQGFEVNEKRRRELEQLIKSVTLDVTQNFPTGDKSADQNGVHPNGVFVDLPSDFLFAVEESVITTEIVGEEIPVLPVKHDEYRKNIRNPYKQPWSNLVWRMDFSRLTDGTGTVTATSKRVELITDGNTTIEDYRLRYLRMPPAIVCDEITEANQVHCVLDPLLHGVIVDEAVKMAAAAINPQEYQIKVAEKQSGEK